MTEPVRSADFVSLDMEGYTRLGAHRRAFDDWLQAVGLGDQLIFYIRFGEGYVEAKCYLDPLRMSVDQEGAAWEWEWRQFRVRTLPPRAALHLDGGDGRD